MKNIFNNKRLNCFAIIKSLLYQPAACSIHISAPILALLFVCWSCQSKTDSQLADPDVYYTCSMDPQVIEAKPGKCPICHMTLTAARKSTRKNDDELQLSPQQIQLGNILVDTIRHGSIGNKIILPGILNFDQLNNSAVSAKIAGRINKLYFKAIGDYIPKGARLFDLYSEELNNAKQEYLLAVQKQKVLGNSIVDYNTIIESAKNRLLLWGMTEEQVAGLKENQPSNVTSFYSNAEGFISALDVKEGDYVSEGSSIIRLANLSTLWAEVQIYPSQLLTFGSAAKATVQFPDLPGKQIAGNIEFVNPEISTSARINLIRIKVPNRGNILKPGMMVYVTLNDPQRKMLSLPLDAVLRSAGMSSVWVQTGSNRFRNKMVETGMESNGMIEIKTGLAEGEVVVVRGAYLLQSEYIFRKGSSPMGGHDMSNMKM
jgi:Cu(I)/Ag(I) efflux system membrane fusion protein